LSLKFLTLLNCITTPQTCRFSTCRSTTRYRPSSRSRTR
jgi:hypothetical protein